MPSVSVNVPENGDEVMTGEDVVFVLSRTGDTSAALDATISWSGTDGLANSPSTTVTFGANETDARLALPSATLVAGDMLQTVTLTVEPAAGYQPGTPATASVRVRPPNRDPMGEPTIRGTLRVGETVMVDATPITDADVIGMPEYTYQWYRADSASGDNAEEINWSQPSYTLTSADLGKHMQVVVLYTDDGGADESVPSAWSAAVMEAAPSEVAVEASTASVVGGENAVFTFTRTGDTARGLTVDIRVTGNGISGTPTTTVTFQMTSALATVSVATNTLTAGAANQSVVLTIQPSSGNAYTVGSNSTATVTVTAPPAVDLPEVTVDAVASSVVGGENAVFTLTRMGGNLAAALPVTISVTGAGASGTPPATATFQASSTTATVSVATNTLTAGAANQSVVLTIQPSSGNAYTVGSNSTATVTVTAPPAVELPVVTVEARASSVTGGENAVFTLTRTGDTASALTVDISVTGNGISGTPPATATFQANSTTATVSVATNTLAAGASRQTVSLTIQPSSGNAYTVGSRRTATVRVEAPTLGYTVTATTATAVEPTPGATPTAANQLVFTVRVSPAPGQATTRSFTLGGTAQRDLDYTVEPASQMLSFGPGVTTQTITVTAIGDIVVESASGETVIITVGGEDPVTGRINEPPDQIAVGTSEPSYRNEDSKTVVSFSFAALSAPAPAGGLEVEWRVSVGGSAGSALGRSAGARARVTCTVSLCGGTVTYPAGDTMLADPTIEAVFDMEAVADREIQVQVRPTAAAANFAVVPAAGIAANEQTAASAAGSDWVVAGVETIVLASRAALSHAVSSFGSTVAANFIASIWRRADVYLNGSMDARAQIGGRSIDTHALTSGNAGQAVRQVASLFGIETASPEDSPTGWTTESGYGGNIDDYRAWAGVPDSGGLAGRTSFTLPVGETKGSGPPLSVWGEFRTAAYEGDPDSGGSVDMELSGTHFGVDYRGGDGMLLGLSASTFSGETDYAADGSDSTNLESDITVFAPYILLRTTSGLSIWTSLGLGEGTLSQMAGASPINADTTMQMFAAGIRHEIWSTNAGSLSIKGDSLQTSMETENASSSDLSGIDVRSSRARLALEYADARTNKSGNAVSHRFELGVRADSMDGSSGAGADIASEMRYVFPDAGLQLQGHASMLLLHSQNGTKEWGLGFGAIYDPGVAGRGMRLALDPAWNTPRSGVAESMWNASSLDDRTSADASASLQARLGYGVGVLDEMALATLYGETEAGSGKQRLRLGAEMRGQDGPLGRLSLDFYGERRESRLATPVHALMLESALSF